MMAMSYADRMRALSDDVRQAEASGDRETMRRLQAEFVQVQAALAKESGDTLMLGLMTAYDEATRAGDCRTAELVFALLYFRRFGNLEPMCEMLAPVIRDAAIWFSGEVRMALAKQEAAEL